MHRINTGYSLIELMVTLVLVALLIGVLLPGLQRAREAAAQTQCLANKMNNGRALLLHVFESDRRFPPMFHAFSPGQSGRIIVRIEPRTPEEAGIDHMEANSLICPGDWDRGTVPVRRGPQVTDQVMSYGYNVELPIKKATLDALARPAIMAVLFDGSMSSSDPGKGKGKGKGVDGVYADSHAFVRAALTARHDQAVNVLFADWHVHRTVDIQPEQVFLP